MKFIEIDNFKQENMCVCFIVSQVVASFSQLAENSR